MIDQILSKKKDELRLSKKIKPLQKIRDEVELLLTSEIPVKRFHDSLIQKNFSIIAEIKSKSPSHGIIRENLHVKDIAEIYQESEHISCISVLTDHQYFGGSLENLRKVRTTTTKPILRKEFIIDEYQLFEARLYGADAVLLISTLLNKEELCRFIEIAKSIKLEPFIECHTREDLNKIPFDDVDIIGINSRDLVGTLNTDLRVIEKMLDHIPAEKTIVAESGVHSPSDLQWLAELGVNAVLIGTGILKHNDISKAISTLMKWKTSP